MKKFLFVIALCSAFILSVGLTACQEQEHEHVYSSEWSQNEDYHWHNCTVENCGETSDKGAHAFEEQETDDDTLIKKCSVCGYAIEDKSAPHEHVFSEEWGKNEDFHWHSCLVEGCLVQSDKEEHLFGNPEITQTDSLIITKYTCVSCGFEKTESFTVETIVENPEQWDKIFEEIELVNYSLKVTFAPKDGSESTYKECHIDENGAYIYSCWFSGQAECYYIKKDNGEFDNYVSVNGSPWEKMSDTSSFGYDNIVTQATLPFTLEDNFDKFAYSEESGSYLSNEELLIDFYTLIDNEKIKLGTLAAFNVEVKVVDGKISYISSEYYFPPELNTESYNDDINYSFIYWNIGRTKVVVPPEVLLASEESVESEVTTD